MSKHETNRLYLFPAIRAIKKYLLFKDKCAPPHEIILRRFFDKKGIDTQSFSKKDMKIFLISIYKIHGYDFINIPNFDLSSKPKNENKYRRNFYLSYLASSKWISFRNKLKFERGNKCEDCGAPGETHELHGHHLTYKRLGNELPEDIKILCKTCHMEIHKKQSQ